MMWKQRIVNVKSMISIPLSFHSIHYQSCLFKCIILTSISHQEFIPFHSYHHIEYESHYSFDYSCKNEHEMTCPSYSSSSIQSKSISNSTCHPPLSLCINNHQLSIFQIEDHFQHPPMLRKPICWLVIYPFDELNANYDNDSTFHHNQIQIHSYFESNISNHYLSFGGRIHHMNISHFHSITFKWRML